MPLKNRILVYEYDWLKIGSEYKSVVYTDSLHKGLVQYLTQNPNCGYYSVYFDRIRFCNYVGAIQIHGVTIEVLPKTDRNDLEKESWQKVLIEMLYISMQLKAKTTTLANIEVKEISVLETYLQMFLAETQRILHYGLVKKYRTQSGNQNAMKGKLMVTQHVTQNIVHAERFFVSYQVYDRNNIYNGILLEALKCIRLLSTSMSTAQWCNKLMLDFPECSDLKISEDVFDRLTFDRKTLRYETAIDLARIILLNYHPDIRGGGNNILAIMFDMNKLWENYVYVMLTKAKHSFEPKVEILPQKRQPFWKHFNGKSLRLKPDIIIRGSREGVNIVIDTKWKYNKDTSIEDVRQLYAYGKYFSAKRRYLLYPEKKQSSIRQSYYYEESNYLLGKEEVSKDERCDLMFVDILQQDNSLRKDIGIKILSLVFQQEQSVIK